MRRLICVFVFRIWHKQVFSWRGSILFLFSWIFEPLHDKTNKMACAHSEDSDQPWHPPSLLRVFAVRMKKAWVFSYPPCAQRRLWSDLADAQADLSLRWAQSFCWLCHEAAHFYFGAYLPVHHRTLFYRPNLFVQGNVPIRGLPQKFVDRLRNFPFSCRMFMKFELGPVAQSMPDRLVFGLSQVRSSCLAKHSFVEIGDIISSAILSLLVNRFGLSLHRISVVWSTECWIVVEGDVKPQNKQTSMKTD